MDIKGIDGVLRPAAAIAGTAAGTEPASADFGQVLRDSLAEVNRLQQEADTAVESLATGKGLSLHETMIALEKADLSFRLMMQVRNKIVEAYREIMSMQV
jgi:flagellar hook-basal body complex protein FliE